MWHKYNRIGNRSRDILRLFGNFFWLLCCDWPIETTPFESKLNLRLSIRAAWRGHAGRAARKDALCWWFVFHLMAKMWDLGLKTWQMGWWKWCEDMTGRKMLSFIWLIFAWILVLRFEVCYLLEENSKICTYQRNLQRQCTSSFLSGWGCLDRGAMRRMKLEIMTAKGKSSVLLMSASSEMLCTYLDLVTGDSKSQTQWFCK